MFEEIVNHIRSEFSEKDKFIPLHEPKFIGNEKKYLIDCIDSTFVSSVGKYVDLFEKIITEITGAKYAVACTNGTSALHTAILLVGSKPQDEILTQPVSFVATCNAIKYANCTPHFVDIDKDTLSISPSKLEDYLSKITYIEQGFCFNKVSKNRIVACIPMHTFGLPGRIDELVEVCKKFHIEVIEDAAESLGSFYKEKHTGTFGKIGVISFNGNKVVTSGGGGAIITDDEVLANKAKHITTTAKVPHAWEYVHNEVGYNYRMPNINAALACAQLENLSVFLEDKRRLAASYANFFSSLGVPFYREISEGKSNYWLNTIQLPTKKERDKFLEYSNKNNVMTRPAWTLLSSLDMYSSSPKADLENAAFLIDRIVNIPSSARI